VQFDFPISAAEAASMGKPGLEGKPYRSSGGEMVWNEELKREVPRGWGVNILGNFGEFKNGINYEGNVVGDRIVRIVNIRDISNTTYFILKEGLDKISLPANDLEKYLVQKSDILIARSGIPGATRLIHKDIEDIIYCGFIIRYNVSDEGMRKYLFFRLKDIELSLTKQAAGTILKNVSQDTLRELRVVLPPQKIIIERFNDIMNPIFDSIYNFSIQSQELTRLRDFLLPLLMNGEVISVKD
jgi:type I restriction enzyme S subunit